MMKKTAILIVSIFFYLCCFGAYLTDVPISITQPDGTVIECFATGDEFYNWAHDKDGYTIIQDKKTGYYCYAILNGEDLIASQYVVSRILPKSANLKPYINISGEKIREIISNSILNMYGEPDSLRSGSQTRALTTGTINNLVVYIRFADQQEFTPNQAVYTTLFNGTNSLDNSMRNYFNEVSYNQLDIISHFYPVNNGTVILSYQDPHNRNYYRKYSEANNPDGYRDYERMTREHTLLYNAIDYIKSQVPTSLNIDSDGDGLVDNVCFIVRGTVEAWSDLLWPHKTSLFTDGLRISIHGKQVWSYNFQLENNIPSYPTGNNSVLCHEMGHTLGVPDLYQSPNNNNRGNPVGTWDVMASNLNPPQHMCAYTKFQYGGWIGTIPSITTPGTYTLQPLTSPSNNCYKIPMQGSSQYLVVEYRKQTGKFESSLKGSGMIIYRINETYKGNIRATGHGGISDEVYVFRPDGSTANNGNIDNAYFSDSPVSGRTTFSNTSNPYGFIVNGDNENHANIYIKNIRENANGTLSFDIGICDNNTVTYSNTNNLPAVTNAFTIQTTGIVTVKSIDTVIFEAGSEVILNPGFEVQQGATFEVNIIDCVY